MIEIRRGEDRGQTRIGWLDSRHTFSFNEYYDPQFTGFRSLRVINEDFVAPGQGFGTHPHRDMEILTWVLEGAVAHRDSTGQTGKLGPGELQHMTAGTGVTHSEFNASPSQPLHLLQIWILPEKRGLPPEYEQRAFPGKELEGRFRLLAGPAGAADGALGIHQDARLYVARLKPGETASYELPPGRHAWVQLARGSGQLNGQTLGAGDGARVSEESAIEFRAEKPAEVLLFDLA
jgi:quercetin 2,3-dioxygenase